MKKELIARNPLLRLSFDFSISIIAYTESLMEIRKYVIANQLLRAATSIGANSMEAQNAESKKDFVHKIKVAAKEAEETQYWLLLCEYGSSYGYPNCAHLIDALTKLQKVISKILSTARKNMESM